MKRIGFIALGVLSSSLLVLCPNCSKNAISSGDHPVIDNNNGKLNDPTKE